MSESGQIYEKAVAALDRAMSTADSARRARLIEEAVFWHTMALELRERELGEERSFAPASRPNPTPKRAKS
ncbi:MAG TPA: hypothetical protein VFE13_10005 [Caulobacteraceae bacterium]|jgi:hypothetical protein|nr:hypothetical protein [Caulobacteraceae bacterium]